MDYRGSLIGYKIDHSQLHLLFAGIVAPQVEIFLGQGFDEIGHGDLNRAMPLDFDGLVDADDDEDGDYHQTQSAIDAEGRDE